MVKKSEPVTSVDGHRAERPDYSQVDVISACDAVDELQAALANARTLETLIESETRVLASLRAQIVKWRVNAEDDGARLPPAMAVAAQALLRAVGSSLTQAFYAMADECTPIDLSKEAEDLIPY